MKLPFCTVLCPTFRKPKLLANALACYLAQTYPADRRELLIFDSAQQFQTQRGEGWRLISLSERPPSLPAKYNLMVASSNPATDIFVVWDDDDVYLPHHVASHAAVMEKRFDTASAKWSKPREVLSTYTGQPLVENAAGRFHGSIAIGSDFLDSIGCWPMTSRADFDQQIIATLQRSMPPCDPIDISPPSYVFRWGSTGAYHSQHVMKSPDDETWYRNVPNISHHKGEKNIILSPIMDDETERLYAEFSIRCRQGISAAVPSRAALIPCRHRGPIVAAVPCEVCGSAGGRSELVAIHECRSPLVAFSRCAGSHFEPIRRHSICSSREHVEP